MARIASQPRQAFIAKIAFLPFSFVLVFVASSSFLLSLLSLLLASSLYLCATFLDRFQVDIERGTPKERADTLMPSRVLCAFEQKLDDFVGAPRIVGFALAKRKSDLPDILYKEFDMDCSVIGLENIHATLKDWIGNDPSGGASVHAAAFKGSRWEQLGNAPVFVTLQRQCTFTIRFPDEDLHEFLSSKTVARDPPSFFGTCHEFTWQPNGCWAWSKIKWEPETVEFGIEEENNDIQIIFSGMNCPDSFLAPQFSSCNLMELDN